MEFTFWYIIIGVLFIGMALAGSLLKRLPVTSSILYLLLGVGVGPLGLGLIMLDPLHDAALLERLTEVAVLVSLFTAGLKLRTPLAHKRWVLPVRLASVSMVITVGLIALVAHFALGLPVGAAILLGAILSPTDPVLASEVQVENPDDHDRLRFGLTGEAGLNDSSAFPFVMLGLGLLGLHDLGEGWWRWFTVDLIWSISGGLVIGSLLGTLVGKLVLYLRREHKEALGLDDFLTLGLIAGAYGIALAAHTYGFLAVFAAGLALRRVEFRATEANNSNADEQLPDNAEPEELATNPQSAPAYLASSLLEFNEQLERIGEVAIVLLLGGMLAMISFESVTWWFIPLLLLVIRPIAVAVGVWGQGAAKGQRRLIAWFGIRGVGSLYYLAYAIEHGLPESLAEQIIGITAATVVVSIIVHGISVTPLMNRYGTRQEQRRAEAPQS